MKPNAFVLKVFALATITLVLMFVLNQVADLASERQRRFQEAERSVEQSQAGRQSLMGPVLLAQCTEEWSSSVVEVNSTKTLTQKREFMVSAVPERLSVQAQATMELRYRGLFKVNTYASKATLQAQWSSLAALQPPHEHAASKIECGTPVLMVAVSDARGLRQAVVKVAGDSLPVIAGTLHPAHPAGFHALWPQALRDADAPFKAEVMLELVGTAELAVVPLADDTHMTLAANWPHPSFGGRFLPVTHDIRDDGFNATWQVSSLATTAPRDFASNALLCRPDEVDASDATGSPGSYRGDGTSPRTVASGHCMESFKVAFIDPVNPYSLSDRAIKYGLLFVGLTFLAVGMVEVLRQLRVHPIQYLLVGCALSVFFLLLLSLSEHLRFDVSYAIAASACGALLTFYAHHVLRGWAAGLAFGGAIAVLYGALYALLQLEQTALVLGSVLLFAVLAGVMVMTRRIDWYRLLDTSRASPVPHPSGGTVPAPSAATQRPDAS